MQLAEYLDEIKIPVVLDKENVLNEFKEIFAKLRGIDSGISIDINTDEASKQSIQEMKNMIAQMQTVISKGMDSINKSVNSFDLAKVIKETGVSLNEFQTGIGQFIKSSSQIDELVKNFDDFKKCITQINELSKRSTPNIVNPNSAKDSSERINKISKEIAETRNLISAKKELSEVENIKSGNTPQLSYANEKAEINKLTEKVNELSSALNEKTEQIVLEENQMRSSASNEVRSLQAILEKVEAVKSDLTEISNFDTKLDIRVSNKRAANDNAGHTAQVDTDSYTATFGSALKALKGKMGELLNSESSVDIVYGLIDQLHNGAVIVKEIDDAMTGLKKVTNETLETYQQFPSVAASIANEVGSTSKAIINSAADWAKLGYSIEEATELAKNAAVYANIGDGIDIDTAASNMASAMKAFNIEAKDSLTLVDKFNEVANNFAVSSDDIGDILKRSSSALAASGNTIDETIALGTAMQEVVQDTSAAGATLNILALRIRGSKTEIEQMGESTDGMAESTSKLRDKVLALTNVTGKGGFDIMTDDHTFKSTYEIMQGIAHTWKEMSNVNQAALLELIVGKNNAQGTAALLNNFSLAEKALLTSVTSMGSAEKENEEYLESLQGKLTLLSAKWHETWSNAINSDTLKYLVDVGREILTIVDKIGLFKVALLSVSALALAKSNGKTIVLALYGCESIAA